LETPPSLTRKNDEVVVHVAQEKVYSPCPSNWSSSLTLGGQDEYAAKWNGIWADRRIIAKFPAVVPHPSATTRSVSEQTLERWTGNGAAFAVDDQYIVGH